MILMMKSFHGLKSGAPLPLRWLSVLTAFAFLRHPAPAAVQGWLSWRGPQQNGMSIERGLPDKIPNKEAALWVADFPGQSTPVIANGKLYIMGYLGDGAD